MTKTTSLNPTPTLVSSQTTMIQNESIDLNASSNEQSKPQQQQSQQQQQQQPQQGFNNNNNNNVNSTHICAANIRR